MSEHKPEKNTDTVEVPRDVLARVLMALDQANAFNCASDLRSCVKPRRWEMTKWVSVYDMENQCSSFVSHRTREHDTPVRVTVEEIQGEGRGLAQWFQVSRDGYDCPQCGANGEYET